MHSIITQIKTNKTAILSRPARALPIEKGGWVSPGTGLDTEAKRKLPCLSWGSNPGRQFVIKYYTNEQPRLFTYVHAKEIIFHVSSRFFLPRVPKILMSGGRRGGGTSRAINAVTCRRSHFLMAVQPQHRLQTHGQVDQGGFTHRTSLKAAHQPKRNNLQRI